MVPSPQVVIVILNWNGKQDTIACLESLQQVDYVNFRVVVVDNGSEDGSMIAIQTRFPDVVLIENGENLGFAEGNNVGLEYALACSADYVLLLNNDTVVDSAFLAEMILVADSDESIGIVAPNILEFSDPERVWSAGAAINWNNGQTYRLRVGETIPATESAFDVEFVSGCALLAKREAIERTGFLDPDYYLYYEEVDWCVRARREGYRILCAPRARIWHKVSGSTSPNSPIVSYYMARNALLFLQRRSTGAERATAMARNLALTLRSVISIYIRRKNVGLRLNAKAQVLGIRDFCRGNFGPANVDLV